MNFRVFIRMVFVSTLRKAHDAEKKKNRPRIRFLRILLYDRNQWSDIVFQFLMAIRTGICVQEIAEFYTTVGKFEFIHDGWLKNFTVLRPVFFWPAGCAAQRGLRQ